IVLLHVPNVLSGERLASVRSRLDGAHWADGKLTAGHQSAKAKNNEQLVETDPLARELGAIVREALAQSPLFFAGALPRYIYPPLFNRYAGGQDFGFHVDNAIRYD